jgi:hypothetical protein
VVHWAWPGGGGQLGEEEEEGMEESLDDAWRKKGSGGSVDHLIATLFNIIRRKPRRGVTRELPQRLANPSSDKRNSIREPTLIRLKNIQVKNLVHNRKVGDRSHDSIPFKVSLITRSRIRGRWGGGGASVG